MARSEAFAGTLLASLPLLLRFTQDFTDDTRAAQASGLPNHAIWTLGHCALTMDRVAERLDGIELPQHAYVQGDGHAGTATQFDTESVCIGSTPTDEARLYPMLERGREIFQAAGERLAAAVAACSNDELDAELQWHDGPMPYWKLIARVAFHNGTHAGQLTDLRRALSMPPVIQINR